MLELRRNTNCRALGTWIPLPDGRVLAERNGVLAKMLPIFDFVPGDRSPPPAPKHLTAAASKPRAPRAPPQPRSRISQPAGTMAQRGRATDMLRSEDQISESHYEDASIMQEAETPDNVSIVSESMVEDDMLPPSQFSTGSRKRKRDVFSMQDQEHRMWADALLDYFMLLESADPPYPPPPPPGVDLDRPIDDKGHSAMHWAVAMGEPDIVKDLIRRGASIDCLSLNRETPLMRAVMYTNNFDKNTMGRMVRILISTVTHTDWFGSTVFHHIAATTSSRNKYLSARYYLDTIINVLGESWTAEDITRLLNRQDNNGDTAIMIAARNGARKCVRALLGRNAAVDIPNHHGETADDLIRELNRRRQARGGRHPSSSPFAPDGRMNGDTAVDHFQAIVGPRYRSQTANTLATSIGPTISEQLEQLAVAYEAELDDKEQDNLETERLLRKRQAEIEVIQIQIAELEALDQQDMNDDGEDTELDGLIRESEALLELEQRMEMKKLLAREEAKMQHATNGNDALNPDVMQEKLKLATALYRAQSERKILVPEIVQNLSVAGIGERQTGYKRLIKGAMGMREEEELENILPDILTELEDGRARERLEATSAA